MNTQFTFLVFICFDLKCVLQVQVQVQVVVAGNVQGMKYMYSSGRQGMIIYTVFLLLLQKLYMTSFRLLANKGHEKEG